MQEIKTVVTQVVTWVMKVLKVRVEVGIGISLKRMVSSVIIVITLDVL